MHNPYLEYCIDTFELPAGWNWYRWEALPRKRSGNATHLQITGAVCTATITKGKRKGQTNWLKRDKSTEKTFVFSVNDFEAWQLERERKTGKCRECYGTGQAWAGWSAETGTKYRTCRRCGGTGKAPESEAQS